MDTQNTPITPEGAATPKPEDIKAPEPPAAPAPAAGGAAETAPEAAAAPAAEGPPPEAAIPDVPLITWTAPIMASHERSPRWYLITGVIVLIFIIGSILTSAWSLTIVIVLMSGVYFLVHRKPSPEKTINIRTTTFVFDGEVIPWADCEGFWLLEGPGYVELHIARKERGGGIVIQTGPVNPEDLHAVLSELLPEIPGKRERPLDTIVRICKI